MFIINYDNKSYLTKGEGDPARTLLRSSAATFNTKELAERFKSKVIEKWSFLRPELKNDLKIEKL